MEKNEMANDLLEVLRKQRHQVHIENLSRIITRVDKDKREMFASAYYSLVEELENTHMAKYLKRFNEWPERTLELIFSSPVGSAFGPVDMPTHHDYLKVVTEAHHIVSCPNCASKVYK